MGTPGGKLLDLGGGAVYRGDTDPAPRVCVPELPVVPLFGVKDDPEAALRCPVDWPGLVDPLPLEYSFCSATIVRQFVS